VTAAEDGAGDHGSSGARPGSRRVRVPGVAGLVGVTMGADGSARGACGTASPLGGDTCRRGCTPPAGAAAAAAAARGGDQGWCEEVELPDLGVSECDGLPLSRQLRQQQGLASWRQQEAALVSTPAAACSGDE
jgi:hypothetical protein